MRISILVASLAALIVCCSFSPIKADTEEEMVQRYLSQSAKKQIKKIGWVSVNYTRSRINRDNNYNRFAMYETNNFTGNSIPWLDQSSAFGIDMGVILNGKMAVGLRGEYWLKLGSSATGTFQYNPPGGTATMITNPTSEIKVLGVAATFNYYIRNNPIPGDGLTKLALRIGATAGYYQADWNLWTEYQNLNLATSSPSGTNTTFRGTAPGFSLTFGADYPINFWDMAVGADFGYSYLNFTNVAWYNSLDQEVIVTYNGTSDSRVDLDLSGFTGKFELKRFFSW